MKKVKKLKVLELDKEVIKKLEEAPMNKLLQLANMMLMILFIIIP